MTEINRELAIKVLSIVDAGLTSGLGNPKPGEMCVEAAVCYAMGLPHGDNPSCVAAALRKLKIKLNDHNWSSNQARAFGLRRLAIAQLGSVEVLDEKEFARKVAAYTIRATVPRALRIAASVLNNVEHKSAMISAATECELKADRASVQEANKIANAAAYAAYAAAYAAADAAAYAAAYAANAADAAADAAAYAAYAAYAAADAAANAAANAAAYAAYAAYAAAAYVADAAAKRDKELATFAEGIVQILIDLKAPGCAFLDLTPVGA